MQAFFTDNGTYQAQEPYVDFYSESLGMNNIGMAVLGSWTLTNISSQEEVWAFISNPFNLKGIFHYRDQKLFERFGRP